MNHLFKPTGIDGVWEAKSDRPGRMVTIGGGIHGDEPAGIQVVEDILTNGIDIEQGGVFALFGNRKAIAQNSRHTGIDLNRCFRQLTEEEAALSPSFRPYELNRAQELLPALDKSHAMLDLHGFSAVDSPEFIICERNALQTARAIGAKVISFGWSQSEPGGTDGYMFEQGREGLCYEIGWNMAPIHDNAVRLGHEAVMRFLSAQNLIPDVFEPIVSNPQLVQTLYAVKREQQDFTWHRMFKSFEPLAPGEPITTQGGYTDYALKDQIIIFPQTHRETPIGAEAYTIGQIVAA